MIRLTRLNHQAIVVNADNIQLVEATPDTMLTLVNGDRVHVRETVDEVVDRSVDYHQRVQAGAVAAIAAAVEAEARPHA